MSLSDQIESDAAKAKQVTVDGQTIVRRDIREEIEANNYVEAKKAATNGNPFFGLRMRKIVPPGGG